MKYLYVLKSLKFWCLYFVLFLMSSCSVSDDKVIGQWKFEYESDVLNNASGIFYIKADHTGEFVCYIAPNIVNDEGLVAGSFTWEKDGYLLNCTGNYSITKKCKYTGSISYDDDESITFTLRYTDGNLVLSSVPGCIQSPTKIKLIKK